MYRRWDKSKPPTGAFALNRDSIQAIDLVSWWPGGPGDNLAADLLGIGDLTSTGNKSTLNGHGAPVQELLGTNYLSSSGIATTSNQVALLASVRPGSLANAYTGVFVRNDGAGFYCELYFKSNGKLALYVGDPGNTSSYDGTGATTLTTGVEYQLGLSCGTAGESNSLSGYVDGALDATTTGVALTPNSAWMVGGSPTTGGRVLTGNVWDMRLYSATRAAAFFAECADPGKRYELWYPLRSRKWFTVAAGASIVGPLVGSRHLASNGPLISGRLAA